MQSQPVGIQTKWPVAAANLIECDGSLVFDRHGEGVYCLLPGGYRRAPPTAADRCRATAGDGRSAPTCERCVAGADGGRENDARTAGSPRRRTGGLRANRHAGTAASCSPRRGAAHRRERGEALGETIGYAVRFERNFSQRTRLLVVTPGVLLRFLLDDPYLSSTGLIVFDEFHERGLESDLALGMARLIQQTVRPELRLVVMSATLAAADVSKYLGDCPIVESEGRLYPVEIIYEPKPESQPWPVAAARAAERLLERISGDLLVFLPGLHEIRQAARHLEPAAAAHDVAVLPLHGDLPGEQQDAALLPQPRRKIVLATNVAETSVTVEGVTGVVDTGLARCWCSTRRWGWIG